MACFSFGANSCVRSFTRNQLLPNPSLAISSQIVLISFLQILFYNLVCCNISRHFYLQIVQVLKSILLQTVCISFPITRKYSLRSVTIPILWVQSLQVNLTIECFICTIEFSRSTLHTHVDIFGQIKLLLDLTE